MIFTTLLVLCGCGRTAAPDQEQASTMPANAATYQLKGIVVSSDPTKGEVTIDGQAIPGFMGAMIMPYRLAQPAIAAELHPGDQVTARLRVSSSASLLDQIDVTAQARPDYKPTRVYNVPAPGQTVPDFKFLNQDGKRVSLSQFRGQVVFVTFIYTRCPLPDYCIRMSRNFAEIQKQLAADPRLYSKTHLLSISFDPTYDTPKVLRSYGSMYAGSSNFSHWDFAAAVPADLNAMEDFFDVGVSPGANNTLSHSLSTAVISPDGKIISWYHGNDWSPAALVDEARRALTANK